jgi:hypothetical protein
MKFMRQLARNREIITEKARDRKWHATAYNKHIGEMAALPLLENVCKIESLSPAQTFVEAATGGNMPTREASTGDSAVDNEKQN